MEAEKKNHKCKECGHVCGSYQGIISHWGYEQRKGNGHKGQASKELSVELTSEPKVRSGGWDKRKGKKRKKRKNNNDFHTTTGRKLLPSSMTSDGPLVIYPLVIRGNEVLHPGSFGIVAVQQQSPLLEALLNDNCD